MPAGPEPQPVAAEELEAFARTVRRAFHDEGRADDVAIDVRTIEPERTLAIREDGELVAVAAICTRRLTVPGGAEVPFAGVSEVGVTPGHTRRGHLGRLMRRQLDDVRAAGREPIAALWASEGGIYGRYGYGPASRATTYDLNLNSARLRPDVPLPDARPRVGTTAEALPAITALHDAARRRRPGMPDRTEPWWARRLYDPPHRRDGSGELQAAVLDGGGYALYSARADWDDLGPSGAVRVRELIALTPEARAGLWSFLLELDLMRTLQWRLGPDDDPLTHLLATVDGLTRRPGVGLWVRIVDAGAALAARTYSAPFSLVLELEDAFCPWNAGRHRLTFDGTAATCEPTSEPADLALGAEALGAAYLGGTTLESLAGAGRVRELRPGALSAASIAFRGAVEPWCPEIF